MDKPKRKRYVAAIYFGTPHLLANLLALKKILGIPVSKGRELCKLPVGETHTLSNVEIDSNLDIDDICDQLSEYEIKICIRVINN